MGITLQIASQVRPLPSLQNIRRWIKTTLTLHSAVKKWDITLRIVDETEMTILNQTYRHKKGPTNVLSFPYEPLKAASVDLVGDIVVCAAVVEQEAFKQQKGCVDHWAHLVVHGTLHLMGYDHERKADAEKMESLEIEILQQLGFKSPY